MDKKGILKNVKSVVASLVASGNLETLYDLFSKSSIDYILIRVRVNPPLLEYKIKADLTSKSVWIDNLLASSSATGLYDCYDIGGEKYRDGGQVAGDNIPYLELEKQPNPDYIIIVSLLSSDDAYIPSGDK